MGAPANDSGMSGPGLTTNPQGPPLGLQRLPDPNNPMVAAPISAQGGEVRAGVEGRVVTGTTPPRPGA